MGLAPVVWGSTLWSTIHIVCLGAPVTLSPNQQTWFVQFFESFPHILPCASCSVHLHEVYSRHSVQNHIEGRDSLFEWSVTIHNEVNKLLGKPTWSTDEALAHWQKKLGDDLATISKNKSPKLIMSKSYIYMATAIVVLLIGVISYRKLKKQK